jgi:hypothetical protein
MLMLGAVVFIDHAHAQTGGGYTVKVEFPGQSGPISGPGTYIKTLYQFAVGLGALLALVMIAIGAVQYTVSEAIPVKSDAKDRILKAILGLVLLISSALILTFLNPDIPKLIEPGVAPVATPTQQGTPQPTAEAPQVAPDPQVPLCNGQPYNGPLNLHCATPGAVCDIIGACSESCVCISIGDNPSLF